MLLLEFEVLAMDYSDAPQVLRDFLIYHETICGHSKATVDQYYLDLRMFLRFLKLDYGLAHGGIGRDLHCGCGSFLPACRNAHGGLQFSGLSVARPRQAAECARAGLEYGLSASSPARKIAAIRSFFKYLTVKAKLLEENPVQDLDS